MTPSPSHATTEGFFLDGRKGLYFIGWNGKARRVGWKSENGVYGI